MPTRRAILSAALASPALPQSSLSEIPSDVVRRHDDRVQPTLTNQVTDPQSPWRGGVPDAAGLYWRGSVAGILDTLGTAFLYKDSRYHGDRLLMERMRLAVGFLERGQTPDGNIDNPVTNFNSPPDTAFAVRPITTILLLAQKQNAREVVAMLEPFLKRAGQALSVGGVHTPNHRWVVCSALAKLNEVFPTPDYVRRIDQWLAEGIDIDADGQFSERSTTVYNPITDRALIEIAAKLNRPALLDPVRRNLESLRYLIHPGDEVVTEISRRQDRFERAKIDSHWFSLQYLAVHDANGQFSALARRCAPGSVSLSTLLEFPEMRRAIPPAPLPENYEHRFPAIGLARIRRGPTSVTLLLGGSSRFLSFRRGDAIVQSVRFASAFFGKGQFVPTAAGKRDGSYHFSQELSAPYWQPLDPPRRLESYEDIQTSKSFRRQSEVCHLKQSATVTETKNGLDVRIQAAGTKDVPLAVEISFAPGGKVTGGQALPGIANGWLCGTGGIEYRTGANGIRMGPGRADHRYVNVRGAEARLAGETVYVTGFTPFDETLRFEWI